MQIWYFTSRHVLACNYLIFKINVSCLWRSQNIICIGEPGEKFHTRKIKIHKYIYIFYFIFILSNLWNTWWSPLRGIWSFCTNREPIEIERVKLGIFCRKFRNTIFSKIQETKKSNFCNRLILLFMNIIKMKIWNWVFFLIKRRYQSPNSPA